MTVRKAIQPDLLERSGLPSRASVKNLAQRAVDSAPSQLSSPADRHTSSRISTMTVEASAAYG